MSQVATLSELQSYVFLLEDEYEEVFTDKEEIKKLLLKEYNIEATIEQISRLDEPTINEEILDLELIHSNAY